MFTVDPSPVPTIKSFKPTSGHVGATVTISGTGFYGTSSVTINGTACGSVVILASTKLTCVVGGRHDDRDDHGDDAGRSGDEHRKLHGSSVAPLDNAVVLPTLTTNTGTRVATQIVVTNHDNGPPLSPTTPAP